MNQKKIICLDMKILYYQLKKIKHMIGDFEISSACILLNTKTLIYTFNISGYKLINEYFPRIYLVYRKNNHFNL